MSVLLKSDLPFPLYRQGKVRDVYSLNDKLLIVCTDRISAFDLVLPCGIPGKGKVLNQISAFWFDKTSFIVPNHVIETIDSLDTISSYSTSELPDYLVGRSMIVANATSIPVECVVRGYLSGSAWAEYNEKGTINGVVMPTGMRESEMLPEPLFTPTTKADEGHDLPLLADDVYKLEAMLTGTCWDALNLMKELEEKSLQLYQFARDFAMSKKIIIADTKFEFGFVNNQLILIDEALTPDSSRFWSAEQYEVGHSQPSFDKQPVRDWLSASGWNKEPPAPILTQEVIEATSQKYKEIYQLFTGKLLNDSVYL
jgi:phosphoribosylaminoimidazole-succinocarboxamide synthase